jgi:V/A-type H+/Na+-transporting ATPase subunit K
VDLIVILLGWAGIFAPTALGAVGSAIGCGRAGQAAAGAMMEADSGYARFVAASALPSSQTIYGIVVTFALQQEVTSTNAPGLAAIGLLTGIALLISSAWQGNAAASAIHASKNKPQVFGLSLAPAAIVEGASVFAFVFALVLAPNIPG